ncbi:hypothetical protein DYB26_013553 [Aphanomyces astaci]|uniref:Poly(A) RNA polymerase mitochondrial-like central palm domain-containing protein n=2 Tax=Aphanomyces astaci TaxID=112090 RepID=A0A397F2A6_APHAT|nr:hypothetical protein DYB34_004073 [Aphanomyces astaci]RHY69835.1 hypothetical protein DYB38_008051 [Aphanomyces astaci]RHY99946.1 hypothetical protein DYB26_013553 [Aphanomyces astaci]RHZ05895.1 hypothetical protein DYB31_014358 [Aphanomyces astaci]
MKLSGLVRELWPHVAVEVYGSTHTQLCLPHSDVDCVLVSSETLTTSPVDMLEALMERLEACAWARNVELLRSARIPILKLHFVKCRHPVKMDVTCGHSPGHSGMEARGVVDQYRMAMPALRPLVIVLKSHLHAKGLNASYSGGLSSYALVLMVVRFLQEELEPHTDEGRQPCVIYTFFRTGTVGMLLLQFLDLHIHFDFHRYGMEYFEIDPAATAVSFPPVSPMVYIMDPLRYNHNIGNSFRIHEEINGVETTLIVSEFSDRIFVAVTQLGTFGTILEATSKENMNGNLHVDISVRLGKRDDPLLLVYARQFLEHFGIPRGKSIVAAVGLKDRSSATFEVVMASLKALLP